ncbi:uncharacterized protein STEHIDRAFT_123252 [Stereum hirsutum FP-91666 SS1]|uniref:uncharacterized protein n=1 Tax=Stereum hirsutum (strain FP-91666) TaxID=721885 RepID=UPI000444961B|nr:uncharacterized protein STEHIDRAFT_123252 [Stereum hirsutum FP-91666 SS1]EIM84469.1 hypothetical protein STEHIDRAFT_123252 [Stereum hirsutum FP-91666 SS1]
MFFFNALSVSLALAASTLAAVTPLSKRQDIPANCIPNLKYVGYYGDSITQYDASCYNLASTCLDSARNGSTDIWSIKTCVAAQTCDPKTAYLFGCLNSNVANTTHLDYNVYANIVGDCAWADGGCPITQQNYIDFIYSALSEIGSSVYPSSVDTVTSSWWTPIVNWAATGTTIPYTNFDDWLHYGGFYN